MRRGRTSEITRSLAERDPVADTWLAGVGVAEMAAEGGGDLACIGPYEVLVAVNECDAARVFSGAAGMAVWGA